MQKALARKQHRHKLNKPNKPKTKSKKQSWRKNVDWAAAGRKAYETRMKNLKKSAKAGTLKSAHGNAEAPQQKIRK
jgi:hypothetical protein